MKDNISKVLGAFGDTLDLVLISLLRGMYCWDDVPGVGKTMLAKCLARSLECGYKRIQITLICCRPTYGDQLLRSEKRRIQFRRPVFTNIVLADEIKQGDTNDAAMPLECRKKGR